MVPDDIIVITVAPIGPPSPGSWTSGEKTTALNAIATLNAQKLEEHTGVNPAGLAAGKTFIRNPANNGWVIGLPPGLARIEQDGTTKITDVSAINAKNGLIVTDDGSGEAGLAPNYGSAANTIAQGNHVHSGVELYRAQFAATGVLSSGSRTLYSANVVPPAGIDWVMEAQVFVQARNNINNGTFNLGIRIGASGAYPEELHEYLTVGGVPNMCEVETSRPFVGGGSIAITVRAVWASGDPVDLRAGRVIVRAWPRR